MHEFVVPVREMRSLPVLTRRISPAAGWQGRAACTGIGEMPTTWMDCAGRGAVRKRRTRRQAAAGRMGSNIVETDLR
jgi:hypothetical protein